MAELWFYHLDRGAVEDTLPMLLTKTLEKGWRALVRAGTPERVRTIDAHLWTYRDDSFLPHGSDADPNAAHQPVLLTVEGCNPNRADALFLIDNAAFPELDAGLEGVERAVLLFSGQDAEVVETARRLWRKAKEAGIEVSYWKQSARGKWEKQA